MWRTIDTAPKDGTIVDVWGPDGRKANAFWDENAYNLTTKDDDGAWRQAYSEMLGPDQVTCTYGFPIEAEPTHWMPLPEKPEELPPSKPV